MNRGFTLIELLAILFILGVITIVSVPGIVEMNKKNENSNIRQYEKTIEDAAEVYVETHLDDDSVIALKSGGEMCIRTSTLIDKGLLSPNLKSPKDGRALSEVSFSVSAKSVDEIITYKYMENDCS